MHDDVFACQPRKLNTEQQCVHHHTEIVFYMLSVSTIMSLLDNT